MIEEGGEIGAVAEIREAVRKGGAALIEGAARGGEATLTDEAERTDDLLIGGWRRTSASREF